MSVLNATLPLVSVLLGAGITYWLSVRQRRRSAVEDLFTQAIAAVAAADASPNYVSYVAYSQTTMTSEEHNAFVKELGREAALNHVRKMADARQALAQVIPYRPDLDRFYRMPRLNFSNAFQN